MKVQQHKTKAVVLLLMCVLAVAVFASADNQDKLDARTLVERHLAALGTPEARAAAKSRTASGLGTIKIVLGGAGEMSGDVVFVSEGDKIGYSLPIGLPKFSEERFTYDGKKAWVGNVEPGRRSRLGRLILVHEELVASGLLGGSLTTAWPLLAPDYRGAKLDYGGLKKVGERQLHQLEIRPKGGSGQLKINLYFDPQTYCHVYSRYDLNVIAKQGTQPDESAKVLEQRYQLEETFSDFQNVDGLTLPVKWEFRLTSEGGIRTSIWTWENAFNRIRQNIPIDPRAFVAE